MATEKSPEKAPEKAPVVKAKAAAAPQSDDPTAPPPPVLVTLAPLSAAVGDPSFSLHVLGSGFTPASVIVIAGQEERTTFVSEHELTTIWNMPLWQGPDPAIPVLVRTDALETQTLVFNLLPPRAVPLDPAHASKPRPAVDLI